MNLTTITQSVLTMTSREIAELTDKEHKNVVRDIRAMLDDLKEDALKFERIYLDSMNREKTEFVLDRELTETLLTGYSAVLRRKVIARWRELEQQAANPQAFNPATLSRLDIIKLAMEAEEGRIKAEAQVLALTHVIEDQKPAVEFVDRFVEAKSAKGFREVAKILGIKEREFIAALNADKIIFKQGSNWLPMADHQHAGRFTVKTGEANGHAFLQTRFTPEGIAWVAKRFTNGNTAGGLTF